MVSPLPVRRATTHPKGSISSELAGVTEAARSRADLIRVEILDGLDQRLSLPEYEEFKKLADKMIAHAGDRQSRLMVNEAAFTLERLEKCQRAIFLVTNFVAGTLLWGNNIGGFPIAQFDQFDQLDGPWCSTPDLPELHKLWNAYATSIDGWGTIEVNDLLT